MPAAAPAMALAISGNSSDSTVGKRPVERCRWYSAKYAAAVRGRVVVRDGAQHGLNSLALAHVDLRRRDAVVESTPGEQRRRGRPGTDIISAFSPPEMIP